MESTAHLGRRFQEEVHPDGLIHDGPQITERQEKKPDPCLKFLYNNG